MLNANIPKVSGKRFYNFGQYHNIFVQVDTLLFLNIPVSFTNRWLEIYELDDAYFFQHLD